MLDEIATDAPRHDRRVDCTSHLAVGADSKLTWSIFDRRQHRTAPPCLQALPTRSLWLVF
jgi:hypothetical protein